MKILTAVLILFLTACSKDKNAKCDFYPLPSEQPITFLAANTVGQTPDQYVFYETQGIVHDGNLFEIQGYFFSIDCSNQKINKVDFHNPLLVFSTSEPGNEHVISTSLPFSAVQRKSGDTLISKIRMDGDDYEFLNIKFIPRKGIIELREINHLNGATNTIVKLKD